MRLLTWNACRGTRISHALQQVEALHSDLITLQECREPTLLDEGAVWRGTDPIQGIAVINTSPALHLEQLEIPRLHPTILPVLVHGPTPFLLVGVWTHPTPTYAAVAAGGVQACLASVTNSPIVVAGDFNISPGVRGQEKSATSFLKRMREEFGLVSAYHSYFGVEPGTEVQPTYYHQRKQTAPFHIDYVFVPEQWAAKVRHVEVGNFEAWRSSDHRPLLVDLDL